MSDATQASIIYRDDGVAQSFSAAVVAAEGADAAELIWNPLIPLGKFFHPVFGEFETTEADATEMIANLQAGLPGVLGIPIAQGPGHLPRSEGAYGWIKELEVRDGVLWGAMNWTADGIEAVGSGNLPYISANWITSAGKHGTYKKSNLIFNAALCVDPFFFDQPELQVAASEYLAGDAAVAAAKKSRDEKAKASQLTLGGDMMATEQLVKDVRAKYEKVNGDVTDEAWAELTKDFADDAAYEKFMAEIKEPEAGEDADDDEPLAPEDELAKLRADNDAAAKALAESEEKAETLGAELAEAKKVSESLEGRVATLEGDKAEAEVKQELAASVVDGHKCSPATIGLMAASTLDPSAENTRALIKHIEGQGGKTHTVPIGEAEAVAATSATGELTGEPWLEAKEIPDADKKAVRAIAASQSIEMEAAYAEYVKPQPR